MKKTTHLSLEFVILSFIVFLLIGVYFSMNYKSKEIVPTIRKQVEERQEYCQLIGYQMYSFTWRNGEVTEQCTNIISSNQESSKKMMEYDTDVIGKLEVLQIEIIGGSR